MLFISYIFLFCFLPITLLIFFGLRRRGLLEASVFSLMLASFVFYTYWKPSDTWVLISTIILNYSIAKYLTRVSDRQAKWLLILGIASNLGLLIYFKYFDFLAYNVAALVGKEYVARGIVMPIGISFFTFTQLAYLVDCYKSRTYEARFSNYALFVTIFPHLIAGPIIHHAEMRPQFARLGREAFDSEMITMGVIMFVIGFAKKVLLADNLVVGADAVFNATDAGAHFDAGGAWIGAIAYTLQIYFDFSGYSDMAIGLALMFGLRLPVNFNSPYKSTSIIEFWRRWHITLSTWLRDYLYIPLGGNRGGELFRLRNVFITFLLGGIWHGAGWTFVIWGALHGTYNVINHLLRKKFPPHDAAATSLVTASKQVVTLLLVIIAWVFFRAKTVDGAVSILKSMVFMAPANAAKYTGADFAIYFWIVLASLLVFFAPNSQQLTHYTANISEQLRLPRIALTASLRERRLAFAPSTAVAVICGLLVAGALARIWRPAIFIYFNF
jgi:alginate O-acetyltransferase complex protein AlgI